MQIKVSENTMIPLGNGKYVRADHVIALEPITGDERGMGNRTRVLIDHAENELIAGRTEHTIIRDMRERVEGDTEQPFEAAPYLDLIGELRQVFTDLPDYAKNMLGEVSEFDIIEIIKKMDDLLGRTEGEDEDLA